MATCRGQRCKAEILFAWTGKKSMPVDPEPHPDGNVRLHRVPDSSRQGGYRYTAEVLGPLEVELARADGTELHMSHHATCVDAAAFR